MFRTRTPLSRFRRISTARLACVRPPASVHPEPGSNSPLYVCFLKLKLNLKLTLWFFLTWLLFYFQWSLILFASSKVYSVSCFRFASAKIKTIFEFAKLFLKFFFSHLNHLYSASTVVLLTIFAVAKVWIIFNMTKSFFKKKFIQISSISSFSFPQQLSLFGIAKVETYTLFTKLFTTFFNIIYLTAWVSVTKI